MQRPSALAPHTHASTHARTFVYTSNSNDALFVRELSTKQSSNITPISSSFSSLANMGCPPFSWVDALDSTDFAFDIPNPPVPRPLRFGRYMALRRRGVVRLSSRAFCLHVICWNNSADVHALVSAHSWSNLISSCFKVCFTNLCLKP